MNPAPIVVAQLGCGYWGPNLLMKGALPSTVAAHGRDYIQTGIHDVVFATLTWANKVTSHIHVSWLDPGKVRKVTLVGGRKMVVFDDGSDDKVTAYDKGVDRVPRIGDKMDYDDFNNYQLLHRFGDIWLPRIESPGRVINQL
jgi:hypothetical protein